MTTTIKSVDPSTLEIIGEVPVTPPSKVETIIQKARQAFPRWRRTGLKERRRIIARMQQCFLEQKFPISETITREMGRPLTESLCLELQAVIDLTGYYTDRAHRYLGDSKVGLHNIFFRRRSSYFYFEPLGTLGIISPWNWPLLIPMGCIVPALLSGNAVVFKPSEYSPLVGEKIKEIVYESGVPEEVFQVIHGGAQTGRALVQADVEKIFFTGSTAVGQKVMEEGAARLRKSVLEMGGSDPAIVCEDADIDITASGIVWGAFSNCGQNCNGIERVYVHESVAEELITKVVEKVRKLRVGDGMEANTDMGPLSNEAQFKKMDRLVKTIRSHGGEILTGGQRCEDVKGYFYQPTVVRLSREAKPCIEEEIFGPLVLITPVRDDDEAVALASRTQYGLASSVWTTNRRHGYNIARRIEAGTVMINDCIVSFGMQEAGWTGVKNSGVGWVHGEKGLDEMVNIKFVNYDPQMHMQKFWWFPYSGNVQKGMEAGLHFLYDKSVFRRLSAVPATLRHFWKYLLKNSRRREKL